MNAKRSIDICLQITDTIQAYKKATPYQFRKIAGENRAKVSKSMVVEVGIQIVLDDVEAKGDKSKLPREILRG